MSVDISAVTERIKQESAFVPTLLEEIEKVIVGQRYMIERLLIGLLTRGHCLLEGVPGLAKTMTISTLSRAIQADFHRLQFTPDLLPADLTGTLIYNQKTAEFIPQKGPVFANIVLADEINRAPAKVQSALLESMQEKQVTIGAETYPLPDPFLVLATQNPLEQEGTYPLPEAQLDRFLLYIKVDYPSGAEEWEITRRVTTGQMGAIQPVMSGEQILAMQDLVTRVPVSDQVLGYAWALVRASRPNTPEAPDFINRWASWGAGPRGVLTLVTCAKARAILQGRYHATAGDIQAVAKPALRHRIAPNYAAQAAEVNSERLIEMLMEQMPADRKYEKPAA